MLLRKKADVYQIVRFCWASLVLEQSNKTLHGTLIAYQSSSKYGEVIPSSSCLLSSPFLFIFRGIKDVKKKISTIWTLRKISFGRVMVSRS